MFQIGAEHCEAFTQLACDLEYPILEGSGPINAEALQQKNQKVNEVLSQMEEYEEEMDLILDDYTLEGFESFSSHENVPNEGQSAGGSFTYSSSKPKRSFFRRYFEENVRDTDWKSTLFLRLFFILLVVMFTNRRCNKQGEYQFQKISPTLEKKFQRQIDSIRELHHFRKD